ncbi:hypothetical protein [uncultured Agrobacterium sp.]|uniref:hypothetical protein n=1 Tax=uncultured Agrobacterium sp. TaxID=157277 RepID=UPI0025DCC46F|nr:hypothetical protein [uncultured Agrobacterium sp.]
MKEILITAAALVFTAGTAFADCVKNIETTAVPPGIDREFTTASISASSEMHQKTALVLKKTDRLPGNAETTVASPESAVARMQ